MDNLETFAVRELVVIKEENAEPDETQENTSSGEDNCLLGDTVVGDPLILGDPVGHLPFNMTDEDALKILEETAYLSDSSADCCMDSDSSDTDSGVMVPFEFVPVKVEPEDEALEEEGLEVEELEAEEILPDPSTSVCHSSRTQAVVVKVEEEEDDNDDEDDDNQRDDLEPFDRVFIEEAEEEIVSEGETCAGQNHRTEHEVQDNTATIHKNETEKDRRKESLCKRYVQRHGGKAAELHKRIIQQAIHKVQGQITFRENLREIWKKKFKTKWRH